LCGDKLTIADFWIGGFYVYTIDNPKISFAKELWSVAADNYPKFKAYGLRFKKANKKYLSKR
jgi:glutathione S-transferase